MTRQRTYWIVYSRVKKKYPYASNQMLHIITYYAIKRSKCRKKEPKGLTADIVTIDEFPLKEG